MTKQPRNFRLPPELDQQLREEAERVGIPQTGIVIAALKKWLGYEDITYSIKLPDGKTIATVTASGTTNQQESA